MLTRGTLLLAVALLMVPATAMAQGGDQGTAETDRVTFYGHVFGHTIGAPMPSNTEAPIGENLYGIGSGGDCESVTPVNDDCREAGFNQLALFSTPGFVDVKDRAEWQREGTYAQLHNERGQTKDILLDTSQNVEATVYITMDTHGWFVGTGETNCLHPHPEDVPCVYPYWGWDPGVAENVVVDATLYKAQLGEHGANASDAPPIEAAIQEADVIAKGQWGPGQVMQGLPGTPQVNAFTIDLGPPQIDEIPKEEDFFLVYTVYQEAGGQNFQIDSDVRWWSGEFFPPTYTLPVKNAFGVERVVPNFAHGKMAIVGVMNTPWGSYDIDPNSVDLTIEGPNGEITPEHISRFGDFSVAHGGHYLPINITWIWDYQRERVAPGQYTITLEAQNFQGSASGACTATFNLRAGQSDRLAPGNVEAGVCGLQSASEAFVDQVTQDASQEGGS